MDSEKLQDMFFVFLKKIDKNLNIDVNKQKFIYHEYIFFIFIKRANSILNNIHYNLIQISIV